MEEAKRRRRGRRECHSLVIVNGIIFDLGGIGKVVQYSIQHYLRRGGKNLVIRGASS